MVNSYSSALAVDDKTLSSRRERLEAVLTDIAVYFTVARYPLVGQLLGQGDSQIIAQIWGRQ